MEELRHRLETAQKKNSVLLKVRKKQAAAHKSNIAKMKKREAKYKAKLRKGA